MARGPEKEDAPGAERILSMKIINTEKEDYHVHSLNFSDGMCTIDEIARYAGEIGMKKIVITDHAQSDIDAAGLAKKNHRAAIKLWTNVHNDVEVLFGVEADILNEKGDICAHIQGMQGDFIMLSCHKENYAGDRKKLTEAYINAINRHHEIIDCIGHLDVMFGDGVDVAKVVELANRYSIPLELNGKGIHQGISNLDALKTILSKADRIYVNSDAHRLSDLRDFRKEGFKFLKDNGFI